MSNVIHLFGDHVGHDGDRNDECSHIVARIEDAQEALDNVSRLLGSINDQGNVEVTAPAMRAALRILEAEYFALNDVSCELRTRWGLTAA